MDPTVARTLWHQLEPLNAVAYFTPECADAATSLGLRGFWMGYFACRAAPMGPVTPGVVEATFYNFHRARVERAIPDAWTIASPATIVEARAAAAAAALRRLLPDGGADALAAAAVAVLTSVIERADPAGRPLFAANRDVPAPDDPVAALWQSATTLREHRGDSHVALLAGAGLDGCEVHVLLAGQAGIDPTMFQQSRGWSPDDWTAATERLAGRGLVDTDGAITMAGRTLRAEIEERTDQLAIVPFEAVGVDAVGSLLDILGEAATTIAHSGEISFPNPMGLPDPTG